MFIDPLGLWTLQIGVSGSGGAGAGGTAGGGIVFGFSWENGFQFGTYDVVGSGGFGGVGGAGVIDITFSTNTDINDLLGLAGTVGGSGTVGGGFPLEAKSISPSVMQHRHGHLALAMGGALIEEHGFVTNTWIQKWTNTK